MYTGKWSRGGGWLRRSCTVRREECRKAGEGRGRRCCGWVEVLIHLNLEDVKRGARARQPPIAGPKEERSLKMRELDSWEAASLVCCASIDPQQRPGGLSAAATRKKPAGKEKKGRLCSAFLAARMRSVWEHSSWATHHTRDEHSQFAESRLPASIHCYFQLLPGVKLRFHVNPTEHY